MHLTDDEIKEMIQEDLADAKIELQDQVREVFEIKKQIDEYITALACTDHNWQWKSPFYIGGVLYKSKTCTKCGYELEMRKVK